MSRFNRQFSAAARQYESESAFDEASEARDEWIDDHADTIAADLMKDEAFVMEALADDQGSESILRDAGRFFARFHATNDANELASIAVAFYRDLTPYVEAAAKDRATDEATAEYDSMRDAA